MFGNDIRKSDSRGKIAIGKEFGGQTFSVERLKNGDIVLHHIPDREVWLYENPEALDSLKRGLAQAGQGDLHYLGSFAEFVDGDDNDEA